MIKGKAYTLTEVQGVAHKIALGGVRDYSSDEFRSAFGTAGVEVFGDAERFVPALRSLGFEALVPEPGKGGTRIVPYEQ